MASIAAILPERDFAVRGNWSERRRKREKRALVFIPRG